MLTDLRDLGYDHVPIKQMLVFALSKIVSREIVYAKKNSPIIGELTFLGIFCAKKTTDESLLYEPFAERK